nr:hypothetical protein [Lapillicoccus jejuensis]
MDEDVAVPLAGVVEGGEDDLAEVDPRAVGRPGAAGVVGLVAGGGQLRGGAPTVATTSPAAATSGLAARNAAVCSSPACCARRRSRNFSGVAAGKTGRSWHTRSVVRPSARWNFTAMPRVAVRRVSVSSGLGNPLEKRTLTGTGSPCRWGAMLSSPALGMAVNVPASVTPAPGWHEVTHTVLCQR